MGADTFDRKPDWRATGGLRPLGAVLPGVTRPALRSRGAAARLMLDWPLIVGPALAAVSTPRRVAARALTLHCKGPVAMELQHLSAQLIERVNAHFGRAVIDRIKLVQHSAPLIPAGKPTTRHAATQPVAIDGLPDGPLRDALARLGGRVRGRNA